MDNRISLAEYLSSYRTVPEKRKVFYAISREMHRFHNNGEVILNLNYQTIGVCFTNPTDIKFASYEKIGNVSIEEVLKIKFNNIKTLTVMAICSFLDSYNYNLPLMNLDVLKENFNSLTSYFYKDDLVYFQKIIFEDEYLYYDDYIRGIDGDNDKFIEKHVEQNDAAFTNYFLLVINLAVVLMLMSYIFLLLE